MGSDASGMGSSEDIVRAGVEGLMKPLSDLLARLAGPFADEVGMAFGDAARVFRYKRALKLLQKVDKMSAQMGVNPSAVPPKLLLPILDHASLEDDEELHDRWAALLVHASDSKAETNIPTSFPEILSQLSSRDALLLDAVQCHVESNLRRHHADHPTTSNWA